MSLKKGDASVRMARWTRKSTPSEERRMMSAVDLLKGESAVDEAGMIVRQQLDKRLNNCSTGQIAVVVEREIDCNVGR